MIIQGIEGVDVQKLVHEAPPKILCRGLRLYIMQIIRSTPRRRTAVAKKRAEEVTSASNTEDQGQRVMEINQDMAHGLAT